MPETHTSGRICGGGGQQRLTRTGQDVADRALADRETEKLVHRHRQTLDADGMGIMQVDRHGREGLPERRTWLQPRPGPRPSQQAQRPPNRRTRVTPGRIGELREQRQNQRVLLFVAQTGEIGWGHPEVRIDSP